MFEKEKDHNTYTLQCIQLKLELLNSFLIHLSPTIRSFIMLPALLFFNPLQQQLLLIAILLLKQTVLEPY